MNDKFTGLNDYVIQMEEENKALEGQIRQMSKSIQSKKSLSPGKYDKYVQ